MVEVEADAARNLLTVRFRGRVGREEMRAWEKRAADAIAGLQPGFRLLTDLTGLDFMEPASAESIERVMDLCSRKELSAVVRIIPDPHKDIGFSIMSVFHYSRKVRIATCKTVEEAEGILAGM